jgi:uncharacterized protein involved in response to NO
MRMASAIQRFALFESGFRPFFLLAGLDALINMAVWLTVYFRPERWPPDAIPAIYWHAHEMLFGFAAAAIGGFLLTAVPNWTGRPPYGGSLLYLLTALWLAGRIASLPFFSIVHIIAAAADLAFFPALALVIMPALLRAGKFSNLALVGLLLLLFAANLCFHLGLDGSPELGQHVGLYAAIDIIVLMIVVIGGRIIPNFTRNALLKHGMQAAVRSHTMIERGAIASTLLMLAFDLALPLSKASGAVSLLAAVLQAIRLGQWQGHRAWREPLLWVLHLGYGWLVFGLFLKAGSLLFALAIAAKWVHALTVGAFTTMILAAMTRASLGHTGRPLVVSKPISAVYLLISLAAAIRIFGPAISPQQYDIIVGLSGGLWVAAFAIYIWIYTPILIRPRRDGKPG